MTTTAILILGLGVLAAGGTIAIAAYMAHNFVKQIRETGAAIRAKINEVDPERLTTIAEDNSRNAESVFGGIIDLIEEAIYLVRRTNIRVETRPMADEKKELS